MKNDLIVTSSAFENGGNIPLKYTGKGEDISIPLEFENVDSNGLSYAIIMDDPDAPTSTPFVHWIIWNIPIKFKKIDENIVKNVVITSLNGAMQGKNDSGKNGYMGPNPPSGTHTYKIKVYVLDTFLDLRENTTKKDLEKEMKNHIIQTGVLEGKFSH